MYLYVSCVQSLCFCVCTDNLELTCTFSLCQLLYMSYICFYSASATGSRCSHEHDHPDPSQRLRHLLAHITDDIIELLEHLCTPTPSAFPPPPPPLYQM